MHAVTIVFPHQLFYDHPCLKKDRPVYLVEEWLFFRQYSFHKKKLLLHRASMQFYRQWLEEQGYTVNYIETIDKRNDVRLLISFLATQGISHIYMADPVDNWLYQRMAKSCAKYSITLVIETTPGFLNTMEAISDYFNKRKAYFQTDFYTQQRKQRKILLRG